MTPPGRPRGSSGTARCSSTARPSRTPRHPSGSWTSSPGWELCKIEDKTVVKGGRIQLNLSGGRNIVLDKNDYKCGDTLKVSFDGQKVLDHVFISEGSQAGAVRTVKELEVVRGPASNLVLFTDGTQTVARNCFVIGSQSPAIRLPEASE